MVSEGAIASALGEASLRVQDLKRIILTHQDIDHVGSLHDLAQASGARVLAHAAEVPYIDGGELPRFARPEIQAEFKKKYVKTRKDHYVFRK